MRNKIIIYILVVIITNIYFIPNQSEEIIINDEKVLNMEKKFITIKGEVTYPGVYTFYDVITLKEVVAYAGGFKESANTEDLRLLEEYDKSTTITINKIVSDPGDVVVRQYNLNEISKEELLSLVGVIKGLTLNRAINIILYRQQNGLFNRVDELLDVKEIGPATYAQISPYFTV